MGWRRRCRTTLSQNKSRIVNRQHTKSIDWLCRRVGVNEFEFEAGGNGMPDCRHFNKVIHVCKPSQYFRRYLAPEFPQLFLRTRRGGSVTRRRNWKPIRWKFGARRPPVVKFRSSPSPPNYISAIWPFIRGP